MSNLFSQEFRDECRKAGSSLKKKLIESINKNPGVRENKGVQYVKICDLLPCPYNREIDQAKVEDIKKAIMDSGVIKPFVVTEVNSEDGEQIMITDGHHRHLALKELIKDGEYKEDSEVPVVMSNGKGIKTADGMAQKEVKESINEARETTIFQIDIGRLEKGEGFRLPGLKFAVIEGTNGWILTNNEAVHWIGKLGEPVTMNVYPEAGSLNYRELPAELSIADLEKYEIASTAIDSPSAIEWREWIHYFGVKSRIGSNYVELLKSMEKIGAVVEMPEFWGKAVKEAQLFPGADDAEMKRRKDEEIAKVQKKFGPTYDKQAEIAQAAGFTDIERLEVEERWGMWIKTVGKKGDLIIRLDTDVDRTPNRVFVSVTQAGTGRRETHNMSLGLLGKSTTIAKRIIDDLLPKFEGGDAGWSAQYNPMARSKKRCAVCTSTIPTKTRHLRLPSGVNVCIDCVKRSARLLSEGVWITEGQAMREDLEGVAPDKKDWIETGDDVFNKILPDLSPEEQKYLKTITSQTYEDTVARVEKYTGIKPSGQNMPRLYSMMMQAVRETMEIEEYNKEYLEELALTLVFKIPEFKIIEDMWLSGDLKIDAKLDTPDLTRLLQDKPDKDDYLAPSEEINMELAEEWQGTDEEDLRRRFANLMVTGGAVHKLYLYNLVVDNLERLHSSLPSYYGVVASMVQLVYWTRPFGFEEGAAGKSGEAAAGSEEVIPDEDGFIVKARGITFPFLVHELAKGFYELLAANKKHKASMAKDTMEDETKDMMVGPGVYKEVMSYIPMDKQEITPLVQKKLTDLSSAEIKDILAKNPAGQAIMRRLVDEAEKEWAQYLKNKEDYQRQGETPTQ